MSKYMTKEIVAVMNAVDAHLKWEQKNEAPRGFERYHPSAFGKCLRLMQYQRYEERGWVKGQHQPTEPTMVRLFGTGHSMHDRWRTYFEKMGVLKGYWQCTNALCNMLDQSGKQKMTPKDFWSMHPDKRRSRFYGKEQLQGVFKPDRCCCGNNKFHYHEVDVVDEELNFYGHCDVILDFSKFDVAKYAEFKNLLAVENLPKKPVVLDLKTINHFGFTDVAKGDSHDYYEIQLMVYANVLDCEYGILLYENKNNNKTAAFRIERSSEELWPEIQRQARLMNEMVEVLLPDGTVDHFLPPPRPFEKDSKECTYCAFKSECHRSSIWNNPEIKEIRREFYGKLLSKDNYE